VKITFLDGVIEKEEVYIKLKVLRYMKGNLMSAN